MRMRACTFFIAGLVCAAVPGAGADASYRIRPGSVEGLNGAAATLSVRLDLNVDGRGEPVGGWSFGICHDAGSAAVLSAEAGEAIPFLRSGAGADFLRIEVFPGGVAEAVIVDLAQAQTAPVRNDLEVLRIRYLFQSRDCPANRSIVVCDTLGDPPLDVACVVGRVAIEPQRENGSMHIGCAPFVALKTAAGVQTPAGRDVRVPVLLSNERPVSGASFALAVREGLLVPTGVDLAGASAGALRGGAGPEYLKIHLGETGRCIGIALIGSLSLDDAAIPMGWEAPFLRVGFNAPFGEGTESLEFTDACGSFAAPRTIVIAGLSLRPETMGSSVVVTEGSAGGFIRGDVNFDRMVNIADAVAVLAFLFAGRPHDCHDAIDANDDGKLDIADAIYLLAFLFGGGPKPRPPFDAPGLDPTPDAIGCARFPF
ncbi:MAG TPA: dockerin type I repeat-containing protein [Planctomycetota bacterium]|jgi:hypothetical protein|nr:hypothetical protein [Planctomycetota bacterium]HQF65291.1 dockerin type I repeat-containing protein [Planctomycetota bacterium]